MPLRILLVALLTVPSSLLIGCVSGVPQTEAVPIIQQPLQVPPPANLTAAPRQLPQPEDGKISTLERNHLAITRAYHQLATQTCGLLRHLHAEPAGCSPWLTTSTGEADHAQ